MARRIAPRLYIGPNSQDVVLNIGMTMGLRDNITDAELYVSRRKCSEQTIYKFPLLSVCNGEAHFTIPTQFLASNVARGFYDAEVYVNGCKVDDIEIIKAPSRFVTEGTTVDNDCGGDTGWEEPKCTEEGTDDSGCVTNNGCLHPVDQSCSSCCNEIVVVDDDEVISKVTVTKSLLANKTVDESLLTSEYIEEE